MLLKCHGARCFREGGEGGSAVCEVENLCIAIGGGVHRLQIGVGVQHALTGSGAVIFYCFSLQAQPIGTVKGADLQSGILGQLVGNGFGFAGLDVKTAFENMNGAERPYMGLVSFNSG